MRGKEDSSATSSRWLISENLWMGCGTVETVPFQNVDLFRFTLNLLKALAHLLVREVVAVQQRVFATVHRVDEAAFLVEVPRHDLPYQLIGISALLCGRSCEFRFELGCEKYFHDAQDTGKPSAWQG